jgi:hypothetical protein
VDDLPIIVGVVWWGLLVFAWGFGLYWLIRRLIDSRQQRREGFPVVMARHDEARQ